MDFEAELGGAVSKEMVLLGMVSGMRREFWLVVDDHAHRRPIAHSAYRAICR